jgi:putative FmdB family regulatory protein
MTYEYACAACGHEWEAEQSIRAEPLKKCPKCGKAQAKRQISRGAGFILKGGGWYADGYGSSGSGGSSKSKSTESGGGSTDGGSGDKPTGSDSKSKTAAA